MCEYPQGSITNEVASLVSWLCKTNLREANYLQDNPAAEANLSVINDNRLPRRNRPLLFAKIK